MDISNPSLRLIHVLTSAHHESRTVHLFSPGYHEPTRSPDHFLARFYDTTATYR